jgi:phosphopantothenoylcysteine decarboxylase / phosphopantothenate---cysteine ligase
VLKDKNIIIGVTGSIAAYKAAILIRLLIKEGARVKVIMTPLSKEFITPLTLATLSKNPILIDFFNPENGDWNSHVDLGTWADGFIIAPATANTIAKMAHGLADNLLLTTYLSSRAKIFVAPAMDVDMYNHPATLDNIQKLSSRGDIVIQPAEGELASGLEGKGRMEEPENILRVVKGYFATSSNEKKNAVNKLSGKKVLVTAGPTYEPIDPVRYIGNYSSGKMGYALAESLILQGAEVYLVSGPVHLKTPAFIKEFIPVQTASEMYAACKKLFKSVDIAILSAAVADYMPVHKALQKIKSTSEELEINLTKTIDIAAELGKMKKDGQLLIGFALETENEKQNALLKLNKKNFDCIVLNSLNDKNAGFGYDTNKISLIGKDNKIHNFGLKMKREVADDIVRFITDKLL